MLHAINVYKENAWCVILQWSIRIKQTDPESFSIILNHHISLPVLSLRVLLNYMLRSDVLRFHRFTKQEFPLERKVSAQGAK